MPGNVSITSCILEHATGVCELWVRCVEKPHFTIYEPIGLEPLSGACRTDLHPQTITDAFALEVWTEVNHAVFRDGRTSLQREDL